MKRLLALAMSAVMALSLTACTSGTDNSSSVPEQSSSVAEERTTIRVGGLKGPTAMGMVKLMEDDAAGTTANDYEFTLAGSADEINPLLIKGELDIAAVPTNVASVLYNKTEGQVEILALNTLGVLYVVENGTPSSPSKTSGARPFTPPVRVLLPNMPSTIFSVRMA